MSPVDPSTVRRIAHLARLRFTDSEVDEYGLELAKILEHVAVLDSLPATSGAATLEVRATPERPDRLTNPSDAANAKQTLANAPDSKDSYFRVPVVISEGS